MAKYNLFALIVAIVVQICVAGPVEQKSGESSPQSSSTAPADTTVRMMPGSHVEKTAKLGQNIYIGYYSSVGAEAELGDNVIVLSDSVIPQKCRVPDHRIVINGPYTVDLVFLLHDLESINSDYRKQHQSSVDAILANDKNFNAKIEEKIHKIFDDLLKNPTSFVKSGDLYVVLRAYLQRLYGAKLDEMLANQENDQTVLQKKDMSTIHFQRNPTNDDANTLNYLAKKLLTIFYVYMSPVTESIDKFTALADTIIKDEMKIVTAQEIMQEMISNSEIEKSKLESELNAKKLLANIPRGTLVGGGLIPSWLGGKKNPDPSASASSSASSYASSSSSSSASSAASTTTADNRKTGGGFLSGIFGSNKQQVSAQSYATAGQKPGLLSKVTGMFGSKKNQAYAESSAGQSSGGGLLSGLLGGKKQSILHSASSAITGQSSGSGLLSGWFGGKKQNSVSSAASSLASMSSASSHSVGSSHSLSNAAVAAASATGLGPNQYTYMTPEHAKYFIEEHGYPCFQYCPYCGGDFVALMQSNTKFGANILRSKSAGSLHGHVQSFAGSNHGQTHTITTKHGGRHHVKSFTGDALNGHSEHIEHRKTNGGSMTSVSTESHSTSGGLLNNAANTLIHNGIGNSGYGHVVSTGTGAVAQSYAHAANQGYVSSGSAAHASSEALEKQRWEQHIMGQHERQRRDERYRISGQTTSTAGAVATGAAVATEAAVATGAAAATAAASSTSTSSSGVTGMHGHGYNQGLSQSEATAATSTLTESSQFGHVGRAQSLGRTGAWDEFSAGGTGINGIVNGVMNNGVVGGAASSSASSSSSSSSSAGQTAGYGGSMAESSAFAESSAGTTVGAF